jgi:hypothetical protein
MMPWHQSARGRVPVLMTARLKYVLFCDRHAKHSVCVVPDLFYDLKFKAGFRSRQECIPYEWIADLFGGTAELL